MSAYSALLDKTVAAIMAQFSRKNAANLFTGRGGKLMDAAKTVKSNNDFELITWLVIQPPSATTNMSSLKLRAELQTALLNLATGDLRTSSTALLGKLGYASHKTLELPTQPQAFAKEVENLLGGSKQLNPAHASLAEWLFQLTNDELPALAAGQASLLTETGGVQTWQVESFVFLAIDLKPGSWSRTRLAALTRELFHLFPMPAVLLFRHPRNDSQVGGTPLLSVSVIHRRANKRDASLDVIEGKVSIIKDIDLGAPHAAHLRILESMALTEVDAKYVPSSFEKLYKAGSRCWMSKN